MAAGGVILAVAAALAIAYQVCAIVASVVFLARKREFGDAGFNGTGVSVLKPIRGLDPRFREAIGSHLALRGEFEVLAGVGHASDPAASVLREFPGVRVVEAKTVAPNGKVGVLTDLAREARYPVLIVSDADIIVEPDYLQRVTAPLEDSRVGLVTCLYRPEGDTFPARFEGLGIATDFAPSTLVARLAGVDEFAMGSTLVFRRRDLERAGGFAAIGEYLADDYQLGHRIHGLGLKCVLSDVIVETHVVGSWSDVWRHQVRWARTIRVSKFWGYLGLPVTFATLWTLVAAAAGRWDLAAALLGARLAMATVAGLLVIRSGDSLRLWPLIPLRDLFGVAVWVAGLFGSTVVWRGIRLRLGAGGRIRPAEAPAQAPVVANDATL
jgi:ceramide glucosyltransferase